MNGQRFDSREIFGAEVQYFRLDPRYWETVLDQFADAGLRCVTTYVQWSTHLVGMPDAEHPAGVLDFEGGTNPQLNLMRFLDLVQQRGLNLNFRCGPFCCNEAIHGGYPSWLVLGDPDLMVWDYQNRATQGYWIAKKEGSQPSYLHPTYLDWCRKWITEVDRIIQPRLKSNGGFITMVNLDNEVSYIVKDSFLDCDYNPVNVRPGGFWHQYLRETYGGAGDLPYDTRYAAIEDVPPPRAVPQRIDRDLAWYMDWMRFKTWTMSRYIGQVRSMHESNGVRDVTFMTNFNPHLPEGVPTRMCDFEKAVGPTGVVGYDFYRGAFLSYSGYQSMARVLKLMNASVRYTWSAEFMAGLWNKDMTDKSRISDDHMRFMARCALAHGCKSIGWFMFHDRDIWGDAPVSSHGHRRTSWNVLHETPAMLFDQLRDWDAMKPCCDVAVVYDLTQHLHTALGDPMPCADNSLHVGTPQIAGVDAGLASQEYVGLFRLVEHAGVQPAAIDILHDPTPLRNYPLVMLPGSPLIDTHANDALTQYVTAGGTLLVSGPWPTLDQDGRPLRFLDASQPASQSPGVELKIGRGKVIWHPQYLAAAKAEQDALDDIAFVSALIDSLPAAHVRIQPVRPVTWIGWKDGGGLGPFEQPRNLGSAILHRSDKAAALFVLAHYIEPARFMLRLADPSIRTLVNIETGEKHPVAGGCVELDMDRKSARIFRVE
ncbi:MAG: beta-galactosidase [Phycisphaerales bacterium]